jgi:hypothetical protein
MPVERVIDPPVATKKPVHVSLPAVTTTARRAESIANRAAEDATAATTGAQLCYETSA